jgi:hypothetical protein
MISHTKGKRESDRKREGGRERERERKSKKCGRTLRIPAGVLWAFLIQSACVIIISIYQIRLFVSCQGENHRTLIFDTYFSKSIKIYNIFSVLFFFKFWRKFKIEISCENETSWRCNYPLLKTCTVNKVANCYKS